MAAVGEVVWALPTGGSACPPARAPDGTLVFGSSDGNLYAANPDGLVKWTFTFGGASCSPPSIDSDGSVYFSAAVSRYPATVTNAIFALNSNGQLRWRILSGAGEVSGLAIGADRTVYVASGDYYSEGLRCVKAISPQGSNLWNFANGRNFFSTPAIGADGTIYVGTVEGILEALRPDGTLLWECYTGDGYLTTPVIDSNGVLFTAGASFHAINTDGQQRWSYALQYGADSGPSCLDPAGVLHAQADYTYYRMNADGSQVQKFSVPSSMSTLRPVLRDAAGTIYAMAYGTEGGRVVALSSAGPEQWHYGGYDISFSDAVLDGNNLLYVPGSDGKLYALRTAAGLDNSAWPHPLHDPQHTGQGRSGPAGTPPLPPA